MSTPSEPPYPGGPHASAQSPWVPVPPGSPPRVPAPVDQPAHPCCHHPVPGTNGLAVASMVLGILWVYWVGSILALVFGYVARRQIRERNESGAGMATAGIVLGWVGLGVCALVLLVAFGSYA